VDVGNMSKSSHSTVSAGDSTPQSTTSSRSDVDRSIQGIAEPRIGHLPVEGRYHRLPRRLEDDYKLAEGK